MLKKWGWKLSWLESPSDSMLSFGAVLLLFFIFLGQVNVSF